jgi:hypothetical protein
MNTVFSHLSIRTILLALAMIFPLAAAAKEEDKGPVLTVSFSGSSSDPAWIYKLDASAGYKFNSHFEIDCGLPVYFVRVPPDNSDGFTSQNGIGNAYIDLRATFRRSDFYFASNLRGAAPTGDEDAGFSSGRVTVDWTNYLDVNLKQWTPFGSIGLANTVSDTYFFTRPFTSLGLAAHAEGGLTFAPASWVNVGGSGYAVIPMGDQKIYSKFVTRQAGVSSSQAGSGNGARNGSAAGRGQNRSFETESVVIAGSEISRDRGFSGWIDLIPSSSIVFEIGYSRSISYDYNSLFFSVQFDFAQMLFRK